MTSWVIEEKIKQLLDWRKARRARQMSSKKLVIAANSKHGHTIPASMLYEMYCLNGEATRHAQNQRQE